MAYDMFLTLDGIDGDGTYEISSFSWGASNSSTLGSATGGGSGKVTFNEITITREVDRASPKIFQACCNGQHIKSAVIAFTEGTGTEGVYLRISMTDVLVSSIAWGSGGDQPTESITLAFEAFDYSVHDPNTGTLLGHFEADTFGQFTYPGGGGSTT